MIQPISSMTGKYPTFKNSSKSDNQDLKKYHFMYRDVLKDIKTDDDFRKKIIEQNERKIIVDGMLVVGLISFSIPFFIKGLKKTSGKLSAVIRPFESLKNNAKVPTVENCKSINEDLRKVLQRQINYAKADKEMISATGEPVAPNRLLLYGPPGVGKSYFGKIYAKSIDAEYMEVMQSDINSMWAGEGVDNWKKVFENIIKEAGKKPDKKFVVTINEIDSMVAPSDKLMSTSASSHAVSILEERSAFLNYLEILKEKVPNVTIIGTTNISPKNNGLDRAAMSRFQNLIEVPYPDKDCMYEALKMNLGKIKDKEKFLKDNEKELKKLAKEMSDRKFSFRNLDYVINEAKNSHLDDFIKGKKEGFKIDYLKQSKDALKLSDGELESRVSKAA